MQTLNKSSYVILGLLSKGDYSGYTIKRIIARTSALYISESNAQIYPVLKNLQKLGLVNSVIDEKSGARNKRIYSLSTQGHTELIKWLQKKCEVDLYREEFLLQLSLGQNLTKAELKQKTLDYRDSIRIRLNKLSGIISHIQIDHAGRPDQPFLLLAYDHIKIVLEAKLQWCEKVIHNNF